MSITHAPGEVLTVTDETFEQEVLQHDKPVLVEFWAEWCPPCRMIAPTLAELGRERAGSLSVRKINNDENPLTGSRFHVLSLPTMILFDNGQPILSLVGARPKSRLLTELDNALAQQA